LSIIIIVPRDGRQPRGTGKKFSQTLDFHSEIWYNVNVPRGKKKKICAGGSAVTKPKRKKE